MRISMDPKEPAYAPYSGPRAKVFLDGEEVKYCITADEEAGLVICHVMDGRSLVIVNGEVKTEERRGKVRIVLDAVPPSLYRSPFDAQAEGVRQLSLRARSVPILPSETRFNFNFDGVPPFAAVRLSMEGAQPKALRLFEIVPELAAQARQAQKERRFVGDARRAGR